MIGKRVDKGVRVRLEWVKAHIGIAGNEMANAFVGAGASWEGEPRWVTEGGARA